MTPRFTAIPWVCIELRAEWEDGGGLVSKFLRWCIDERIRNDRSGGVGPTFAIQYVHPDDAEKCIAWLKAHGARRSGP